MTQPPTHPSASKQSSELSHLSTQKPLIYDVGMHNGDDSAFYLHCGYRVLAIEANPKFVREAAFRFRRELSCKDLTILNVAVSDGSALQDFWICEETPEWSSLDPSVAGRDGGKAHSIEVQTVRFHEILSSYGLPEYLKIDIEKSDLLCLNDLDEDSLPAYISVESECGGSEAEMQPEEYLATLNALYAKGYRHFKLVNQDTLIPVYPGRCSAEMFSRESIDRFRLALEARCSWRFNHGCSGPWGDAIESPWMSWQEAATIYRFCRESFFATRSEPLYAFWFDWHAARQDLADKRHNVNPLTSKPRYVAQSV